jgi:hypothetical protein
LTFRVVAGRHPDGSVGDAAPAVHLRVHIDVRTGQDVERAARDQVHDRLVDVHVACGRMLTGPV